MLLPLIVSPAQPICVATPERPITTRSLTNAIEDAAGYTGYAFVPNVMHDNGKWSMVLLNHGMPVAFLSNTEEPTTESIAVCTATTDEEKAAAKAEGRPYTEINYDTPLTKQLWLARVPEEMYAKIFMEFLDSHDEEASRNSDTPICPSGWNDDLSSIIKTVRHQLG